MAITISGTAGCNFNLTRVDTADATGSIAGITYQTESAVRSVTYTNSSKIATFTGAVGTTGTTIDLFSLADANDGTYYMRLSSNTSGISLTSILILCIHNKSAGNITVEPGAANSFLTASEQITIPAGGCFMFSYGTAQTVSATVRNFKLTGAAVDYDCEVYILGA